MQKSAKNAPEQLFGLIFLFHDEKTMKKTGFPKSFVISLLASNTMQMMPERGMESLSSLM
jgi:hypothetical protein